MREQLREQLREQRREQLRFPWGVVGVGWLLLGQSFANLWDKVYKHFSDVKQASVFDCANLLH